MTTNPMNFFKKHELLERPNPYKLQIQMTRDELQTCASIVEAFEGYIDVIADEAKKRDQEREEDDGEVSVEFHHVQRLYDDVKAIIEKLRSAELSPIQQEMLRYLRIAPIYENVENDELAQSLFSLASFIRNR